MPVLRVTWQKTMGVFGNHTTPPLYIKPFMNTPLWGSGCSHGRIVCAVIPGIGLTRDSWVSVLYAEELNSGKSSATHQSTDRHEILVRQVALKRK
jgi:hypothetical protein